jgi:hypothetical protein
MTLSDAASHAVIQHFIVHCGEIGDVVWPVPEARRAIGLWLAAAGDAVSIRHVTAAEAAGAGWEVFNTNPADERPLFVTVEGVAPEGPELMRVVAAATGGDAQPVLLLDIEPDATTAGALRNAGWRLTDAREFHC